MDVLESEPFNGFQIVLRGFRRGFERHRDAILRRQHEEIVPLPCKNRVIESASAQQRVYAFAAKQPVVAGAAIDDVVARTAIELVVAFAAEDFVGAAEALNRIV